MQGRGVTNYSTEKPSHSFSTNTTEFDDALLARKIITFEQAMMAKGASSTEAARLARVKMEEEENASRRDKIQYKIENDSDSDSDAVNVEHSSLDDESDIAQYRSKRLVQLQYGNVIPISRTDWNREVNDSSQSQWVVIVLTSTSSAPNLNPYHREVCIKVEQDIIPYIAGKYHEVKWVSIPSTSAIENWPDENLPTLFCYHKGKLQCQLVGLEDFGNHVSHDIVEYKLAKMGVIESDMDMDLDEILYNSKQRHSVHGVEKNYGRSKFQGGMATFATTNNDDDDDLSDYDDVD